jgi:hypothetical protein
MKLKLQGVTDESQALARAQRMNWKTVGKFFFKQDCVSFHRKMRQLQ